MGSISYNGDDVLLYIRDHPGCKYSELLDVSDMMDGKLRSLISKLVWRGYITKRNLPSEPSTPRAYRLTGMGETYLRNHPGIIGFAAEGGVKSIISSEVEPVTELNKFDDVLYQLESLADELNTESETWIHKELEKIIKLIKEMRELEH